MEWLKKNNDVLLTEDGKTIPCNCPICNQPIEGVNDPVYSPTKITYICPKYHIFGFGRK